MEGVYDFYDLLFQEFEDFLMNTKEDDTATEEGTMMTGMEKEFRKVDGRIPILKRQMSKHIGNDGRIRILK